MTMDADRFAAIVEAYGAAPARWPEAERAAAQAFARAHPAVCRPVLEEAAALDAWLALDARAEPAGEALHARAVAAAPAVDNVVAIAPRSRPAMRPSPFGGARLAAALAACAVMGVAIGYTGAPGGGNGGDDGLAELDAAFGAAFGLAGEQGEGG